MKVLSGTSAVALAALLTAACGEEVVGRIRLEIDAPDTLLLVEGSGGYEVELTTIDDLPLPGTPSAFVPFRRGKQEVLLELGSAAIFDGASTLPAAITVRAVPARTGASQEASGRTSVTLRRGAEASARVALRLDPRPITGTFHVAPVSTADGAPLNGRGLQIQWTASTSLTGWTVHAWIHDTVSDAWVPAGAFAGEVESSVLVLETETDRPWWNAPALEVVLTAETSDARLERPRGSVVARGAMSAEARQALSPALEVGGHLAKIITLLDPSLAHAAIAAGGIGRTPPSSDCKLHAEHVLLTLHGDQEFANGGDLNGNGQPDHLVDADTQGIRTGHLLPMLQESPSPSPLAAYAETDVALADLFVDARVIATSIEASLTAAGVAARGIATAFDANSTQPNEAVGQALVDATQAILGDPFEATGDTGTRGVLQLIHRVETLGRFALVAEPRGR